MIVKLIAGESIEVLAKRVREGYWRERLVSFEHETMVVFVFAPKVPAEVELIALSTLQRLSDLSGVNLYVSKPGGFMGVIRPMS